MAGNYREMQSGVQDAATGARQRDAYAVRQRRMAALALADESMLEGEAARIASALSYAFLRRPEAGLVMLEGRAGNSGQRFNLGEMLVTRCVVRLEPQPGAPATEGYAFIQGNRPRHAELAALFDALLQQEEWSAALERSLIAPLAARRKEILRQRAQDTAATLVEFFTLVRGEDA
ncbi:MAG: phosphonate C-P lyase system protein PhnG [Deltaproteobacteria bacterium]|jgi:alpha-D-ribose 1-methylphosphonate 5-triphosphate synthase subunit PhnG|nr:phosphonate C-P lyase system protein PhnG [Deltaproteobacteria bacterium]